MASRVVTSEAPITITTENETHPALVLRAQPGNVPDGQSSTSSGGRRHAITWAPGTVDNEYMGKKKSKCCCIYEKPRNWDDPSSSSSDSDEDDIDPRPKRCTEHCRGHTRSCYTKKSASKQKEAPAGSSPTVIEQQELPINLSESHHNEHS